MFEIQVYSKRKHPVEPFFWITSILVFGILGLWFFLDLKLPGFFYIGSVIVIGVLRIIILMHGYDSVGEVSTLTVDEDAIHFFDVKLRISSVEKIVIRLTDGRIQYGRDRNNYLEIKTEYGLSYKLGILINDANDEKQVEGIICSLKPKVQNLTYTGYL